MIYVRKNPHAAGTWPHSLLPAAAVAMLVAFPAMGNAEKKNGMSPTELVEVMKKGGNVIFIRHATTEKDYADQVKAKMGDCSTQRTLSEAGWKEAKSIGKAFEASEIPVDQVVSSQYCRAWQTADLAFGTYEKHPDLNFEPAEDYTEEQTEAMKTQMTRHLSEKPTAGSNTVLVGHDDPFEAATGVYPEPMGVTYVLKPDGDGAFKVLGSIAPDQWPNK